MIKYFFGIILVLLIISCQSKEELKLEVNLLDSTVFHQILKENMGNVLVVNVWATWCVPCVEEMPDLIKLAKNYKSGNVKVIGVSIDYIAEIHSKIIPFIKKHNLNFPVYVNNFDKDEEFINFFNKEWTGAVPATFVYDKNGIQKEYLIGKQNFEDLKKAVEKLL